MHPHRTLTIGLLLLAGVATSAVAQLQFSASHQIHLQGGIGGGRFTLANTGAAAVPLSLHAAPSFDQTSHTLLIKPKVSFALAAGGDLPATIDHGQTLAIQANVSDASGTSAAVVDIFNNTDELGKLTMVALDAPLNLTIDGDGAPGKPLAFTYKSPVSITLKNGDAEAYDVDWAFQIEGHIPSQPASVTIPANGSVRLPLRPTALDYSILDAIRPSSHAGLLLISLHVPTPPAASPAASTAQPPTQIASTLFPAKTLPVSLTMKRLGAFGTAVSSYAYISLVLFLGGVFSVLGSAVLPNVLRKIGLRAQLRDLADRTTGVSTRVDSYLRVLLRLERKKIDIMIQDAGVLSLSSTENFDQIATAMDQLGKRLTVAERLDDLRRKFEVASATAPPSVTEDIDKKLQSAAEQLHAFTLTEAQLGAATLFLDKANDTLTTLDKTDALAAQISANFKALLTRLASFPPTYYMGQSGLPPAPAQPQPAQPQPAAPTLLVAQAAPLIGPDLNAALPGIFAILQRPFDDPKNLACEMLFAVDHGIAAIHLALNYAMVYVRLPAPGMPSCDAKTELARKRLLDHECDLIELLGTLSWRALREATLLVQEMREGIYELDVLNEIGKRGQAEITFDTQKARPYLPVFFSITFKDQRFNQAAAIQRLLCNWLFPDDLTEQGWKVCHFFPGDRPIGRLRKLFHRSHPRPKADAQTGIPPANPVPEPPAGPHPALAADAGAQSKAAPKPDPKNAFPQKIPISAVIRSQRVPQPPAAVPPPAPAQAAAPAQVPAPAQPPTSPQHRIDSHIELQPPAPTQEHSRAVAEGLRFSIAFGVALVGLLSGALDQLDKLDFLPASVAILALGFGADSVKNILTQAPKTSAPTKPPAQS